MRDQRLHEDSTTILPAKQWVVYYEDGYTKRNIGKDSHIESRQDAEDVAKYYKDKYPDRKGKYIIKAEPFEDVWGQIYGYARGGRRLTQKQREEIIERINASDDGRSPYPWLMLSDEIESRDIEEIFKKASGYRPGHPGTPEDWERGKKAVKEYLEGIDRKKKKTAPKSKRIKKTALEAILPTKSKIKSMKSRAEAKIKSVYSPPVTLNLRKKKAKKVVSKRKPSGKK